MSLTEEQKQCIECQKCCVDVQIDTAYENNDREAIDFYRKRGFSIIEGDDGYLVFEIAFPCPQLTKKGCRIYPRRPKICREYSGEEDYENKCFLTRLRRKTRKR